MKLVYVLSSSLILAGSLGYFTLLPPTNSLASALGLGRAGGNISSNRETNSQNQILSQLGQNELAESKKTVGGLYVTSAEREIEVFPLKHTEVKARIAGNLSRVEVTQSFENNFSKPLEAIYVFPLPDEAAVDDMEIKIGDRIIKGEIEEREEARKIYEDAKRQGQTAGLLEQQRANIFTQSLANVKPGEAIEVTIRYTESLQFEEGEYEFVFPMVVGPRYISGDRLDGAGNTNRVPDATQITPPILPPGKRSGHNIGVTVEIDAGVPVAKVSSPSHQINTSNAGQILRVELSKQDAIPNKDLILRYRVAGEKTAATVLSQADARGGHFALYLIPALEYQRNEIVPKDVVFLMDTSGSQSGDPLAKSKELMRRFIEGLNPNDTFTIIDFANTATTLSPKPLANTPQNRQQALGYIDRVHANGGTELLNGIKTMLNFPAAPEGRLRSIVLVTDGYIGDEAKVIAEVQRRLKPGNRLYSFGVGSSPNRFLLNRLAEVGRGTARVVSQNESTAKVAQEFSEQINNPVLTNIEVLWEGGGSSPQLYPMSPPDLFAQQPLVLFGRKGDRVSGRLRIKGITAGGRHYEQAFPINFESGGNPAIPQLWGRYRIKELMNQMYGGETVSGVKAVTDTALAYRLLSQYTAFVAVSEEVRVNPDGTTERVEVPVELPEGMIYEEVLESEDRRSAIPRANRAPGATLGRTAAGSAAAPVNGVGRVRGPGYPQQPQQTTLGGGNRGPVANPPIAFEPPEPEAIALGRIEAISGDGLDSNALSRLTRHLESAAIPDGISGEVVWELTIRNGRVVRIVFDDIVSTVSERSLLNAIKDALSSWQFPQATPNKIRLKLRVKP